MIVSHRHRFIFFAVPRTATHAIRTALAPHLGDQDWQQQRLFDEQSLPIPALAQIGHGHLSAGQVRTHLAEELWESCFKFAFVRNPFDRFVSACFFLHRRVPAFQDDPTGHMKRLLGFPRFRQRVLILPQLAQLAAHDGVPAMDFIGRYERLQADFDTVCRRVGIGPVSLEKRNASRRGDYAGYYDAELRAMVEDFYRDDLRTFGYSFAAASPIT